MDFNSIYWPDSQIEEIKIKYDALSMLIFDDAQKKRFLVKCTGFAGITDLCIWDDTIISDANVHAADEQDNELLQSLYTVYDKDYDYGGRSLSDGLLELKVKLVNDLSFYIYCQKIDVEQTP